MSESGPAQESIPIDEYVDFAVEIQHANQLNGRQMDEMFKELVAKAKKYQTQCQTLDARVKSMENVILKQWQQFYRLRDKLDETSKKLELAEAKAKANESKYNRIYNRVKAILLDSAIDSGNSDNNNSV